MCEHGRILHHLANHLQNRKNVALFVGYQAEGTLGRLFVVHGEPEASASFAEWARANSSAKVTVPEPGQSAEL